ncbi:MAG: hypothetical protein AAFW69_06355 [Pseudomonadota bacterium]
MFRAAALALILVAFQTPSHAQDVLPLPVVSELIAEAVSERPDVVSVAITSDHLVRVTLTSGQEVTIAPDILQRVLATDDRSVDVLVGDFVSAMLIEMPRDGELRIILRSGQLTAEDVELYSRELTAGLRGYLVQDSPTAIMYMHDASAQIAGRSVPSLWAEADANMEALAAQADIVRGWANVVILDGYYEASLLMAEAFWERQAALVAGPLLAIVPARDVLVFADGSEPGIHARLKDLATQSYDEYAYPVSPEVLRWTGSTWVVAD